MIMQAETKKDRPRYQHGRPRYRRTQKKSTCIAIVANRAGKDKEYILNVFEMIAAQQKGKENTAPWMVGEQLKEICRREPIAAELVEKDLAVKEMSLVECEKKIKAWADSHKKGSCAVVPPNVAEGIIRKFYGIPEPKESGQSRALAPTGSGDIIDITSFL